ncbi:MULTISPECIES: hypothetical protein [Paenarthrobacter]|uniref:Integral membrane protein n=1 Tax=Paenarthrobacter ureafaciens TaxID=37931 RepID=A0AAX3EFN0_PAEUR|nr:MULTISPECIES: hypothetical protein [Paenarthrobacter]NKR11790.1 hypothetical protein [Arthrobacter sp. M5]NKR16865.1 hypothetical protein [Arthrobacter sp. M6]OEH60506.1 hypothetical protein A5N13_06010 [Arthrobacter sp. D4]OEH61122.1 hypothetical protein A5N17_17050 [Arthrobacter sp. D2]MDO5866064.1 hypothetical protein [Paenarthrobacter sp. SD-2]
MNQLRPGPHDSQSSGTDTNAGTATPDSTATTSGAAGKFEAVAGPFTVRDLTVFGSVLLMFIASLLPMFGGRYNLWNLGNLFFLLLGVILPLVVAALFVARRLQPGTNIRIGSLSIDQFASVTAAFALPLFFLTIADSFNGSVLLGLVGSVGLLAATVLGPHLPFLSVDFKGRAETPAHVVARQAAVTIRKPAAPKAPKVPKDGKSGVGPAVPGFTGSASASGAQAPVPQQTPVAQQTGSQQPSAHTPATHSAPATQAAPRTADQSARGPQQGAQEPASREPGNSSAALGTAAGTPAAAAQGGDQPAAAQRGTAQPAAAQPGTAQPAAGQPSAAEPSATQPAAAQPGTTQPGAAQEAAAQQAASRQAAAEQVGQPAAQQQSNERPWAATMATPIVSSDTRTVSDSIGATVDPASRPDESQDAPHYEAFWFAVAQPRTAYDQRTGAPAFVIQPGGWVLALEDRGHEFLVQDTDGKLGVLRELSNIERG